MLMVALSVIVFQGTLVRKTGNILHVGPQGRLSKSFEYVIVTLLYGMFCYCTIAYF